MKAVYVAIYCGGRLVPARVLDRTTGEAHCLCCRRRTRVVVELGAVRFKRAA